MEREEEVQDEEKEEECKPDDVTVQIVVFPQLSVFSLDRWLDFCFCSIYIHDTRYNTRYNT